ncbi:MAG: helix-turn-helix domain-containing protein [Acidaminobacteraceae bacterium]
MPKIIEDLKTNILKESKELLIANGYNKLSMRSVSSRCEIAVGTLYNYFPNKESLVVHIFREDWIVVSLQIDSLIYIDSDCKEKFRQIYNLLSSFSNTYLSTFYEMASKKNSSKCIESDKFKPIYQKVSELIDYEKSKNNIISVVDSNTLAEFIVSNLLYLNRSKYISFDDLYILLSIQGGL